MSSPGETPTPAISGNSTAQTAPTPDFSALPQTALHQLSSLAQKSSAGYNKLSASAQSKFHETQGKTRAVEYSKLAAEAQAKLHSVQDRIRVVDLKSLPAEAQSKFQEAQEKIRAVEYSKFPAEAQAKFHEAQGRILAVDYKSLPAEVVDWIKAHPYQTAFHIVGGVVFIAPGLVAGPVLGLLGWTSVGPRAASFASFIQATFGTGAAGGVFATLQSAAMGGYGVTAVATGVRAGTVASWLLGRKRKEGERAGDGEAGDGRTEDGNEGGEKAEGEKAEGEKVEGEKVEGEKVEEVKVEGGKVEGERVENEEMKNKAIEGTKMENKKVEDKKVGDENVEDNDESEPLEKSKL